MTFFTVFWNWNHGKKKIVSANISILYDIHIDHLTLDWILGQWKFLTWYSGLLENDFFFLSGHYVQRVHCSCRNPVFLTLCAHHHKPGVKVFISPGYTTKDSKPYGRDLETHSMPGISFKMFLKIFGYAI